MKQIQVSVMRGANFSPSSLMYRYAAMTPGVSFFRDRYGASRLRIGDKVYDYHHWAISTDADIITVYLEEVAAL